MLVSLAHPDDESFGMAGTIARYANEGVEISLICATNGDVGSADPAYTEKYETMAELRLAELRCAAEELGFSGVYTFGYRDSGMPGTPDNNHPDSLYAAELTEVVRRVVRVIREVRPQVVVTFDPFGGYGHPDHVKMHRATTKAFHAAGDPAKFPRHMHEGLAPYQPQKLYYMTFDRRFMRLVVWLMPLIGQDPAAMGRNHDINFREIAAHSYPIHARISTRRVADQAERARTCHESQLGGFGTGIVQHLRYLLAGPYTDTFMRAYPVANGRGTEHDLFAGVDGTR
jgi:LmbE family N-acetylglucosaminyl deacetylase